MKIKFLLLGLCILSACSNQPSRLTASDDANALLPKVEVLYAKEAVPMAPALLIKDQKKGVIYFNDVQREEHRIVIKNGNVLTSKGKKQPDTHSVSANNHENYVMDTKGNFYIFDEHTFPKIRHSSILAGGPVAGAGEIQILDGHITYIDSDSGHYPTAHVFKHVVEELVREGVPMNQVVVPAN